MNEFEIASTLESEFVRRKREGNPNYQHPPFGDVFPRLANDCIKYNLDPVDFIAAQFRDMKSEHVNLKSLFKAEARNKCIVHTCDRKISEIDIFNYCKEYLYEQIKNVGRSVEKILMDDTMNFPAWFRVVITKEPMIEIMTKYRYIARTELNDEIKQVCLDNKLDWNRINGD